MPADARPTRGPTSCAKYAGAGHIAGHHADRTGVIQPDDEPSSATVTPQGTAVIIQSVALQRGFAPARRGMPSWQAHAGTCSLHDLLNRLD
jgi:hypothetical protein